MVLQATGGFRPKAMRDFKYKQLKLALLTNRNGESKPEIAATFRVPVVKERRENQGKKAKWYVEHENILADGFTTLISLYRITFTVFCVPAPSICLASFVTALAIKADAFDPSIDSVETLLQRPNLEGTGYLPLKWKEEFKECDLFPMNDATWSRIWHQGCLAVGLRDADRPYVLRVGTGMDLDGMLAAFHSYEALSLLLILIIPFFRHSFSSTT
jgi:hypothetical protein